jgi:ribosome-binding factor A
MPREFTRDMRLGAEITRLLNQLLLAELKDPGLSGVRVTEVEVTRDLGTARIFFSTLNPDDEVGPALEAFNRAAGFIRSRVGREIRLRRVPELRFFRDDSARRGMELTRLIAEVAPAPPAATGDSDAADTTNTQPDDPDRNDP